MAPDVRIYIDFFFSNRNFKPLFGLSKMYVKLIGDLTLISCSLLWSLGAQSVGLPANIDSQNKKLQLQQLT